MTNQQIIASLRNNAYELRRNNKELKIKIKKITDELILVTKERDEYIQRYVYGDK